MFFDIGNTKNIVCRRQDFLLEALEVEAVVLSKIPNFLVKFRY